MATTLQLPSFPRHGILLNPSPSTSPYSHTTSLPGTPNLVSSLSSLSSSASSSSPHNLAEQDNYFLTYAAVRDPYSAIPRGGSSQNPGSSVSRNNSAKKPSSAPQTRRIRFAPLPEPRRDELQLPDVFLDDSVENLSNFPVSRDAIDTPRSNSGAPSSLLFSDHHTPSDSTPTTSNANLQLASSSKPTVAPINTASSSTSGSDKDDSSDWDITTPVSPNIALSSSVERLPQSCPESPLGRRPELSREKKSFTKKLLKPLLGPLGRSTISTEDVLTLGVNQLFRSSTRDSDDGLSSGAATPAGASTPARSHSKERSSSASDSECGFGVPLSRSTSDGAKKRKTFLGFSHGNSSSSDGGLWRTQSGPSDLRRVQSKEVKESEDATRPRRGSTNQMYGPGRQLRMLNGRVYGAKRSNLAKTNLFANARTDDNEFVEWGYGGMGSVKTAASVGADNKWARVQGNSALGVGATQTGWGKDRREAVDDDYDGSSMAWLKKRKEQREQARKEAEAKAAKEAAEKENHDAQQTPSEAPEPAAEKSEAKEGNPEEVAAKEAQHVTTAIALPAHHRPVHHHSRSMERVPSSGSHIIKATPERRDSEDTARAVSPPVPAGALIDAQQVAGEMELPERAGNARVRRESESSASGVSSFGSDDEDADVEDSPKDSYGEEDEEESEDDEATRRTCLGAGVEKISRHKEKTAAHPQDGHGAT